MDYAVIAVGGSQFKIKKGDFFEVPLSFSEKKKTLKVSDVLLYHQGKTLHIGTPRVKGVSVTCEHQGTVRGEKVITYKYKRRKSSHFKKGHRQKKQRFLVKDISAAS